MSAQSNDTNEYEARKTLPPGAEMTLAEYMAHILDETQQATRASLQTSALPPSGRGSDHETVRPCAA